MLALTLLAAACPLTLHDNTAYASSNIVGMQSTASVDLCCAACTALPTCAYFSWAEATKACTLMKKITGKVSRSGTTSGGAAGPACPLTLHNGTAYSSSSIVGFNATATAAACCDLCVKPCAFFTWTAASEACVLMSSVASSVARAGAVSGGAAPSPSPSPPPGPSPPTPAGGGCVTPADCSPPHGVCTEGTCSCKAGWAGPACATRAAVNCSHGGTPTAAGGACACPCTGWTGATCDTWNPSVDPALLAAEIKKFAAQSAAYQRSLPTQVLPRSVGTGFDIVSGEAKLLPIVSMSYYKPDKTWRGFLLPVEAEFTEVQVVEPVPSAWVFDDEGALAAQLAAWWGDQQGVGGAFSPNATGLTTLDAWYKSYFAGDTALSVTRSSYAVYEMDLPMSDKTKAWWESNYTLDRFAELVIDCLPPSYDNNKAAYATFVDMFGTSFSSHAHAGGSIDLFVSWDYELLQQPLGPGGKRFTDSILKGQAKLDMDTWTGAALPTPYARQDSAEHCFRSNALSCTAVACILIPAECSAVS